MFTDGFSCEGVNVLCLQLFTAQTLRSHKGSRNSEHSWPRNICLSWSFNSLGGWRGELTGRVGPMAVRARVRARVRSRALVLQRGVTLTAVGRGQGDGGRAEGAGARAGEEPATYWIHQRRNKNNILHIM